MEIKETRQSQLPLCKIKYGTWKDFQSIGNLPKTFSDFIRIISSLVYPFDFSIYYISNDYAMIPIASSTTYKNLVKFTQREKNQKEVKIFIILHENENKKDSQIISQNLSKTIKSSELQNIGSDDDNKNGSDNSNEDDEKRSKRNKKGISSRETNRDLPSVCIQCY